MNIILTGPRQIGKSTVINRVLDYLKDRLNYKICGINTYSKSNVNGGKDIFLSPILDNQTQYFLGSRKNKQNIFCNSQIFDTIGVALISEKADLVIIDEIGNLEENSIKYLKAIENILKDDSKNTIIVVQQELSNQIKSFLDCTNLKYEITQNNRDAVVEEIINLLA